MVAPSRQDVLRWLAKSIIKLVYCYEIGLCILQKWESVREPSGNWLVASSPMVGAVLVLSVLPVLLGTVLLYAFFCIKREGLVFPVPYLFLAYPVNSMVI